MFESDEKYVSAKDPTGGKLNHLTPLESGLYGSNFIGNYYILELFSKKKLISGMLSTKDISKVNLEIKKMGLGYNLDYLSDRVGNVLIKVKPNKFKVKLVLANSSKGIEINFTNIEEQIETGEYILQFR